MVSKRICLRLSGLVVTVLGLALVLSTGATAQASAVVATAKPSQPSSAVGGLSVSLSTTAADATQVTYTLGFAVSATGALAANQGTFTLNLPSGSAYAGGSGNPIVFDDLTSGQTGSLGYLDSGTTLQVPVPIAMAAGDTLEVSLTGITNAGTAGPQSLTVSTSSDTTPATAAYTLTSGNAPVASLGNVTLSTSAAGASGVTYTFEFTASSTGALVAGHADFTLVLPAGSSYPGGASGGLVFDDLTSGQSGSYTYLESSSTLTNFVPVNVAPGDKAVTYLSPQALSVTAPKASGLLDVRVKTAGGTSAKTAADRFFSGVAPSVTKVSPAKGPAAGGTTVTITGNGFTSVTQVSFGGLAAAKFSVKSATRIVAVTPKAAAGPADVLVANPAGANANSAAFNYLAAQTAYVATGTGVVPVSVATGKAGPVIKVAGAAHVATTPDGQTVFVSGSKGVTPVSTAANLPGGVIKAGKDPGAIAVTPDGAIAYVVNYGSNSVTPIAASTGLPGKAVAVGKQPDAIAITPNGKTAYVANYGSNTVTPVTIATGKAGRPIRVGVHPDALVVTPDGRTVYVVNGGSNALTPIATATGKAGKAIATGKTPTSAAITPDGKTVYVVNQGSGTLSLITSATGKVAKTISIGKNPEAITITA